ncbi:MAG: hypothetical protein K6L80_04915 [Agarilytica sp.]
MNITQPSTTLIAMLLCMLAAIAFYKTQMPQSQKASGIQINQRQQHPNTATAPSVSQEKLQTAIALLTSKQSSNRTSADKAPEQLVYQTVENSQRLIKGENIDNTTSPFDILPIQSPALQYDTTKNHITDLEEKLLTEEYDGEWAPEMEIKARNIFKKAALKNSNIETTDCRTSLCKITITHKDAAAEQTFYNALAPIFQDQRGKLVRQLSDDGRPSTTLYQFRENAHNQK